MNQLDQGENADTGHGGPPTQRLDPEAALQRLVEGNQRFVAGNRTPFSLVERRAEHAHGQNPIAVIIGCADSRFPPKLAFDAAPGDLFIVRVAGNIVGDDCLASVEYAVEFLQVPLVVVLGHSDCGAVHAAIDVLDHDRELPGRLHSLIDRITPAVRSARSGGATDDELMSAAAEVNVTRACYDLRHATPVLNRRVTAGDVRVVGGMYDLVSGEFKITNA